MRLSVTAFDLAVPLLPLPVMTAPQPAEYDGYHVTGLLNSGRNSS